MSIRVSSRFFSQDQSLPLQPRVLEVQNNADRKTGDAEVVQHLAALMVRNALDRLRVKDQLLLHYKIGDIFSRDLTFIHEPRRSCCVYGMPLSRNSTQRQFS